MAYLLALVQKTPLNNESLAGSAPCVTHCRGYMSSTGTTSSCQETLPNFKQQLW